MRRTVPFLFALFVVISEVGENPIKLNYTFVKMIKKLHTKREPEGWKRNIIGENERNRKKARESERNERSTKEAGRNWKELEQIERNRKEL